MLPKAVQIPEIFGVVFVLRGSGAVPLSHSRVGAPSILQSKE